MHHQGGALFGDAFLLYKKIFFFLFLFVSIESIIFATK